MCCCVLVPVAANAANLLCPWSVSLSGCGARGTPCRRARRVLHPASLQACKPARPQSCKTGRYLGTEVRAEGLTYHIHALNRAPQRARHSQSIPRLLRGVGQWSAFCLPCAAAATVLVCSLARPLLVIFDLGTAWRTWDTPRGAHSFLSAHAILLRRRFALRGLAKARHERRSDGARHLILLAQPGRAQASSSLLPQPQSACWNRSPPRASHDKAGLWAFQKLISAALSSALAHLSPTLSHPNTTPKQTGSERAESLRRCVAESLADDDGRRPQDHTHSPWAPTANHHHNSPSGPCLAVNLCTAVFRNERNVLRVFRTLRGAFPTGPPAALRSRSSNTCPLFFPSHGLGGRWTIGGTSREQATCVRLSE